MTRAIILAATIALIAVGYLERPKPVTPVETKYCPVTYYTYAPDPFTGESRKVWYETWGPCSDMDRYEWA